MRSLFFIILIICVLPLNAWKLPKRNANALTGSEFMNKVKDLPLNDREEAIFTQIAEGNMPSSLISPTVIEDTLYDCNGRAHWVKMEILPDFLAMRYEVAARYDNGLSSFPMVALPLQNAHPERHTYNQYTLRLPQATLQKRDRFCAYLQAEGIPTIVYYPLPLHRQLAFAGCARAIDPEGNINRGLPVSESLCNEVVSLPMHTELTPEEQHYIIRKIIEYPFF